MALRHVSHHWEFGIALHESGLNTVSAGLRVSRPELFEFRNEIPIKEASPTDPAHVLTLYALVNRPVAFDLHPVLTSPQLGVDTFFVDVDLSFSLTDSVLGTVTRVGARLQADGEFTIVEGKARIVARRFAVVELRGEHPNTMALVAGAVESGAALQVFYGISDDALGRTFRAIMNYVIKLFLTDALKRAVVEFPVPPLNELVEFDGLGKLPIQALRIRNDSFYVHTGRDLGGPSDFPAPAERIVHLRVGATEAGIARVLKAFLPLPVPIDARVGDWLRVFSGNLNIPAIFIDVRPGNEVLGARVHLEGLIEFRFHIGIPIFGGHLDFMIPLPLDRMTSYWGGARALFAIDKPDSPDPRARLMIHPELGFLEAWLVFIQTDYADYFRREFRDVVRRYRDRLLGKKFCKIPIIGWLVCGVIDVVSQVLGFLVGFALDVIVSPVLTLLVNTIGRALAAIFLDKPRQIFSLQQSKLVELCGTTVKSGAVAQVDDGRAGELEFRLWFDDLGLPVPPLPSPIEPIPAPDFPDEPTIPGLPELTEYAAADFQPVLALPVPVWPEDGRQQYRVVLHDNGTTAQYNMLVTFEKRADRWVIGYTMEPVGGGGERTITWAEYEGDSLVALRGEITRIRPEQTVRQVVAYDAENRKAIGSLGVDGEASLQRSTALRVGVPFDFEDAWIFRFAHAAIDASTRGVFGRIEVSPPFEAVNWVREIPVRVSVEEANVTIFATDGSSDDLPVWRIGAADEESTILADVLRDDRGLLTSERTMRDGSAIRLERVL